MELRKSLTTPFDLVSSSNAPILRDSEYGTLSDDQQSTQQQTQSINNKRISTPIQYLISILIGILFGILLNVFNVKDNIVILCTLPGSLFLRALQCTVIPMMFFNIVCSIYDVFGSGSAGSLGKRAIWLYTLTTVIATIEGILMANIFSSLLESDNGESDDDDGVKVSLVCPEDEGIITVLNDGSVLCIPHDQLDSYNITGK